MPSFQLVGIDPAPFVPLFDRSDRELHAIGARRVVADATPGFPCRVSLEDAGMGEELLLLPYRHQPADSPYRSSGPIFVRRGARRPGLAPGEIPPYVSRRLLALRGYDSAGMMVAAELGEGSAAAAAIVAMFADPQVAYLHLHNPRRGCFLCRVERVADPA